MCYVCLGQRRRPNVRLYSETEHTRKRAVSTVSAAKQMGCVQIDQLRPPAADSEMGPDRLKADEFSAPRQPSCTFVHTTIACSTIVLQYV